MQTIFFFLREIGRLQLLLWPGFTLNYIVTLFQYNCKRKPAFQVSALGFSLKINGWPIHNMMFQGGEMKPARTSDPQASLKKAAMKLRNRHQQAVVSKYPSREGWIFFFYHSIYLKTGQNGTSINT